ncbi:MAG: histidinol dehydrogenase [Succinivibrio sp.]
MEVSNWNEISPEQQKALLTRPAQASSAKVQGIVEGIISRIRAEGDKALLEFSRTLDHYEGGSIEMSKDEQDAACARLGSDLKEAIDVAWGNIRSFHMCQQSAHVDAVTWPGITCSLREHPIESVGLYVPGGSAPLVSTALMLSVPAMIAGCEQIILCSPPPVSDAIVYAARKSGVTRIFRLGGAQAIAAMAYGTKTVPRVLKIFGPGNQFVTMAKRLVSNDPSGAAIDMPAGPSEVMVVADDSANPSYVAADLLSQAEHGPDSQVLLVTVSHDLAQKALSEVERQVQALPRREIALKSLSHSHAVVARSVEQACAIACEYAPEHLILQVEDPEGYLGRIRNVGSIFVGAYTPESLGDYASGTNHTLPTYGYAKTCSALGTADYRRRYTVQHATREGLMGIAKVVEALADAEGLGAHRNAVAVRTGEIK